MGAGHQNAERSWDLCVSSYGKDAISVAGPCEYLTQQPRQRKFQAIYDLFFEGSPPVAI